MEHCRGVVPVTLVVMLGSMVNAAGPATNGRLPHPLDNNLKCIDLTDLAGDMPLDVDRSWQILAQSEDWELSTWPPTLGRSTLGYPTVVRNDRGPTPDDRFYLYYAHHDPNSGIGCAVADSIQGPYWKLAALDPARRDSRVLVNPGKPGDGFHYSSPWVVWNEEAGLWFMYVHFQSGGLHRRKTWNRGFGHQMTGLATCSDLAENTWTLFTDATLPSPPGQPPLVPVLPTTRERWMNSQSSYHAIQRLPDGRWLAFLRGTGTLPKQHQDPCTLGFATSANGRSWDYFPENPIIRQAEDGARQGVFRPHFVGYLGEGEYLLCWSESRPYDSAPDLLYGRTRDFKTVTRDPRGFARWPSPDGPISPWREGDKLYLFAGRQLHVMTLPVRTE